ncbi:hypothetical protein HID58_050329 [Brassica napus]|uniref:RNase H type-1 domain-containing protein n=1 Tax=Brassica napus TaxID=3708 RepID=A0ABQ8A5V8_BRANA|nr:hypothetical protein HID58_050329 [Brassica napus]
MQFSANGRGLGLEKGHDHCATAWTKENVWIRSDNLELIKAINSKAFSMELYEVFKDIEFLSVSLDFILFSHVLRSCNVRADYLAKDAHLHVPLALS